MIRLLHSNIEQSKVLSYFIPQHQHAKYIDTLLTCYVACDMHLFSREHALLDGEFRLAHQDEDALSDNETTWLGVTRKS